MNGALQKLVLSVIGSVLAFVMTKFIADNWDYFKSLPHPSEATADTVPSDVNKIPESAETGPAPVPIPSLAASPTTPSVVPVTQSPNQSPEGSDSTCHPRILMIQDRIWPKMQRFLDPENQECIEVGQGARLFVTIQTCDGRVANTGSVNLAAEFSSAYVGVSESVDSGYLGVALVRNQDGFVSSNNLSLKGSYLKLIVNGIGGDFCGVGIKGFTPHREY